MRECSISELPALRKPFKSQGKISQVRLLGHSKWQKWQALGKVASYSVYCGGEVALETRIFRLRTLEAENPRHVCDLLPSRQKLPNLRQRERKQFLCSKGYINYERCHPIGQATSSNNSKAASLKCLGDFAQQKTRSLLCPLEPANPHCRS